MTQGDAKYPEAVSKLEQPILNKLIEKYGYTNICWPIVLSYKNRTISYLYESNNKNSINKGGHVRPISKSGITNWFLDYTSEPKKYNPDDNELESLLDNKYNSNYEFVLNNDDYRSVDLDYVWYNGQGFKGFELTTFYVEFNNKENALRLISNMNKRPSWQSEHGAIAFNVIVDAARDLSIEYYLICANTISKVGSELKTDGNVCLIRMTHSLIHELEQGKEPSNVMFMTFNELLEWL